MVKHRNTNAGIIMSAPLQITFEKRNNNYIVIGGFNASMSRLPRVQYVVADPQSQAKASDIDKIVVY